LASTARLPVRDAHRRCMSVKIENDVVERLLP
jgi:hypothetical protein